MDWYNRCACGAIRYEIAAEPVMAGHCQCRDCQGDSGTGHASHIAFARDAAQLSGQASHWDKPAESGKVVTRALCPYLRITGLLYQYRHSRAVFGRAARLDDPSRYTPQMVVWAESGYAWDHTDAALPKFEKMP
jgi:hypothetical protein